LVAATAALGKDAIRSTNEDASMSPEIYSSLVRASKAGTAPARRTQQ
jgi:hypothetical protein